MSASVTLWPWQRRTLWGVAVSSVALLVADAEWAATGLLAVLTVAFLMLTGLRLAALTEIATADDRGQAAGIEGDDELPLYTVLVPLYREAAAVPGLIAALEAIDYPAERLEILIIVEQGDEDTRRTIGRHLLAPHFRVLVVPDGVPRTKPRALQYALGLTRGELLVVFDAEDEPEPDQLRRVVATFAEARDDTACVQARLNVDNWDETWLTRQFAVEYTVLFDAILPAITRLGLPVPLGGTSNHFRRSALVAAGGWDPYNVTEDADLGMRLARRRMGVALCASTTWEEAPATLSGWLGQRTRWLKGWMQTYLVHMRAPSRLVRDLGVRRFLGFQVLIGGPVLSALVHPWVYVLALLGMASSGGSWPPADGLAQVVWWVGLANLVLGYATAIALGAVAVRRRGRGRLSLSALAMPIYWLAISLAAHRALYDLVIRPHHWRKTEHRARHEAAHGHVRQSAIAGLVLGQNRDAR
ncbi:MAG: glycosyltransferase [Pseudomonadota bacterium]